MALRNLMLVAVAVLTLTAASPTALATPGQAALSTTEAVGLDGVVTITGPEARLFIAGDGPADVLIGNLTGTATIWTWRSARADVDGVPPVDGIHVRRSLDDASADVVPIRKATLRIMAEDLPFNLAAVGRGGAVGVTGPIQDAGLPYVLKEAAEPGARIFPPLHRQPDALDVRLPAGWSYVGDYLEFAHGVFPLPTPHAFRLDGPIALQSDAGTVTFEDAEGATHTYHLGPQREPDAPGGGAADVVTYRRLVVNATADGATFHVPGIWGLGAPRLSWRVSGTGTWPAAEGTIRAGDEEAAFHDATVAVTGDFLVEPGSNLAGSPLKSNEYTAAGDFRRVTVDDDVVVLSATAGGPWSVTTVAATGAVAAALLIAVRVILSGYTRIDPSQALQHPVRQALYREIKTSDGIHKRELQRRAGIGWGTLVHHLRVLEGAGYVRSVTGPGWSAIQVTNDPDASRLAPEIVHPLARAVYETIPADGTVMPFHELCERVGASRQLVNYHARRLEAQGWIRSLRASGRGRHVQRCAGRP